MRSRIRLVFTLIGAISTELAARLAMRWFLTPLSRPIEPEEAQFLASAETRPLRAPSGELHVYEWPAAKADAPTVLLVHGWISHAARMAEIVRALCARGMHVVAFDAPAHGRSAGAQADLQAFRGAIRLVISNFGPVQGVLAHSFGALATASWLAEDQPVGLKAVVLVGMMQDLGYVYESFAEVAELKPKVRARFREMIRARYGAYPEEVTSGTLVRNLRLPVLLVHGGADEVVPTEHAHTVSRELRDGHLLIAPDLGHGAPLRDPATVARIVGFLTEVLEG